MDKLDSLATHGVIAAGILLGFPVAMTEFKKPLSDQLVSCLKSNF
jgi:hypothetical protein